MTDDLARWTDGLDAGRRGELVQEKADRRVWKVQLGGRTAFAKRGKGGKREEIRREARNARDVAAAGFGPEVLASGRTADGAEWLVTAEAEGIAGATWTGFLRQAPEPGAPGMLRTLAAAVRRLHEVGFSFPDLTAPHVFVAGSRVSLIDTARMARTRGLPSRELRARDLAAFVFSAPDLRSDRRLRLRFLCAASPDTGAARRELLRLVDDEIAKLAGRTRWRHRWYTLSDPERYTGALAAASADPSDAWFGWGDLFDPARHRIVRTLPDRENRTLGTGPDGRPLFYVKVFPPTRKGPSPAMREVEAIERFRRAGIPVHRLAAHAEDLDRGSLVAVAACDGEPLDDLLRRGIPRAERRSLAAQTGAIWRRMREAGLRHRDAYACHVFVARTADPLRHEIRLIDLTRAGPAPWPRSRWYVKDAAQLWHGARPAGATSRDAVAWLRAAFGVPRLTADARRFARKVAAKERSIAARQARRAARG